MSASTSPTSWYFDSLSLSKLIIETVAPNFTTVPDNFDTSISSAWEIILSISATLPSIKLCFSRAAWYSAFSERSPLLLASAIAFIIIGLSTVLRCLS